MHSKDRVVNWSLFTILSLVWGSSFILMKLGLQSLSAYQVACIRMASAGIILLPFAIRGMKTIDKNKLPLIVLSGLLGSFIPAILFCYAQTRIDSALAGILNALTPICVILIGAIIFKRKTTRNQLIGVVIGFGGLCLLFLSKGKIDLTTAPYSLLVLLATFSYGLNVNMVNRYLLNTPSLDIAAFAFSILLIPALIILWFTGFFQLDLTNKDILFATGAASVLGITGTAMATILFYMLLKKAGPLFSSMVTYGIPFVAIIWGWLAGESITTLQLLCLGMILSGVYISRK